MPVIPPAQALFADLLKFLKTPIPSGQHVSIAVSLFAEQQIVVEADHRYVTNAAVYVYGRLGYITGEPGKPTIRGRGRLIPLTNPFLVEDNREMIDVDMSLSYATAEDGSGPPDLNCVFFGVIESGSEGVRKFQYFRLCQFEIDPLYALSVSTSASPDSPKGTACALSLVKKGPSTAL